MIKKYITQIFDWAEPVLWKRLLVTALFYLITGGIGILLVFLIKYFIGIIALFILLLIMFGWLVYETAK